MKQLTNFSKFMITDEDIQKIITAQKELFPTKTDFENFKDEMKNDFNDLQTAVDSYAEKKADSYFQEMLMLTHKVERHEQ